MLNLYTLPRRLIAHASNTQPLADLGLVGYVLKEITIPAGVDPTLGGGPLGAQTALR